MDCPQLLRSYLRLFDPAGNPAIAYGGDSLYYAVWDGVSWSIEVVDSSGCVGASASLAFLTSFRPSGNWANRPKSMLMSLMV